ncbi:uncharacterized protein LOC133625508 [Colius striatus]|uniref:uncharacterized protein LOC133625508 n=1 Tax=Colius striatus TaxID=57412 RepID=UPI002B1D393A|nr:uncharacterized protein LOC133625508 [Colius striatus]
MPGSFPGLLSSASLNVIFSFATPYFQLTFTICLDLVPLTTGESKSTIATKGQLPTTFSKRVPRAGRKGNTPSSLRAAHSPPVPSAAPSRPPRAASPLLLPWPRPPPSALSLPPLARRDGNGAASPPRTRKRRPARGLARSRGCPLPRLAPAPPPPSTPTTVRESPRPLLSVAPRSRHSGRARRSESWPAGQGAPGAAAAAPELPRPQARFLPLGVRDSLRPCPPRSPSPPPLPEGKSRRALPMQGAAWGAAARGDAAAAGSKLPAGLGRVQYGLGR